MILAWAPDLSKNKRQYSGQPLQFRTRNRIGKGFNHTRLFERFLQTGDWSGLSQWTQYRANSGNAVNNRLQSTGSLKKPFSMLLLDVMPTPKSDSIVGMFFY
mgnify:CR=1 FL=1